uniref:F-box domain-containing protein n=1 Tax=Aegilops tauschii TaxID=37682 RepID=M8CXE5_AEGTA
MAVICEEDRESCGVLVKSIRERGTATRDEGTAQAVRSVHRRLPPPWKIVQQRKHGIRPAPTLLKVHLPRKQLPHMRNLIRRRITTTPTASVRYLTKILVVILSRLPIRQAASTSCLARRWSNLWKNVTHVDLHAHTVSVSVGTLDGQDREAQAAEFIQKVDSILAARAGVGMRVLETFSVWSSHLTRAHAAAVDGWWAVLAESATRVERFVLRTARKSTREAMGGGHVEPYEFQLDSLAAVGSRLREVRLQNCGLRHLVANPSPFSSLAVVKLEFVPATDRQLQSLLDGCGTAALCGTFSSCAATGSPGCAWRTRGSGNCRWTAAETSRACEFMRRCFAGSATSAI